MSPLRAPPPASSTLDCRAPRFVLGLALGLAVSLLLLLARQGCGSAQHTARSVALHSGGGSGGGGDSTYRSIFEHAAGVAPGVDDLAAVWGAVGCGKGIYLDIGSNVGVQVRKLYHPNQFPGASVLPIFEQLFGPAPRAGVCAIGFEPNPRHTAYLATLNAWFRRRGYPALIFTDTAVGREKGTLPFYGDAAAEPKVHEWGASLTNVPRMQGSNSTVTQVAVIDLVDFFARVIRPILDVEQRKTGRRPPVAMKMDVEGAEYAVIPGLILSGALCEVNVAFLEWHADDMKPNGSLSVDRNYMPNVVRELQKASPRCRTQLSTVDDESFVDGPSIPLP